jgi:hypothetical protein
MLFIEVMENLLNNGTQIEVSEKVVLYATSISDENIWNYFKE